MEISNYFNDEPRWNSIFPRNTLSKRKAGAYVIILDDKNSKGTHRVSLFIERNRAIYFNYFEIKYTSQEIWNNIRGKSIIHNIFKKQHNESNMCGFYCVTFMEDMLAVKTNLDYTNFFSLKYYQKI